MSEVAAIQDVRRLSSGVADAASSYSVPVTAVDAISGVIDNSYQSFLAQVPVDWEIKPLGKIAKIVGGGTPSRDTKSFWGGGVPWVTPGEVSKEGSKYLIATAERITAAGLAGSGANLLPLGSLLVTTRATLGARAIAGVPVATNQGFKSLVFPSTTDADFYFYLAPKFKPELVRRASGTTFLEISSREFARIEVPCPPVDEKRWIAQILDTLDNTIRQTEAIIAKLKQVKQGLLHDLLSRGIDANGALRPPQSEAPHRYKQSPLGWMPKEWSVSSIDEICSNVVDCPHSTPVFRDDGVLVARTMHIKLGVFLKQLASRVSEADYKARIARLRPEPGDVVFTREAPVGEAFVIPVGMRICLGQRVMLLRPHADKLCGDFLVAQIYSGVVADRIAALTAGTTNPHLNVAEVRRFVVPLPSVNEQRAIGLHLSRLEERIQTEATQRDKLIITKSGLMDDLLTGRVRVTPLLEAAATP